MRKKSILLRLIPWIIAIVLVAGAAFVLNKIYTSPGKSFARDTKIIYFEGDGKPLTMENEQLLFEMDGATSQFKVTNKETGKVWFSNPENRENDKIARGTTLEYLSCTLNVSYYDDINKTEMNNYTGSIKNQSFEILPEDDGSIRVNYSLGKNAGKRYIIPNALTRERYDFFLKQMSKKDQGKFKNHYTLYETKKLSSKKNKDEIIALYPSVEEQDLYILKSDRKDEQKKQAEDLLKKAGYTEEDYQKDQELMAGEKDSTGPVFNISVLYRLEGKDLVVSVPYSDIACSSDYPLVFVDVLPMFGAAGTDQEGFTLVPEGGGAIIRYNNGRLSQSSYYANMYGWDYGTKRETATSETENAFPVFGMSHEDGSFICIMEGADSYGGVCADISGRLNEYNTVFGRYNILHSDNVEVDEKKSARLFLMYEKEIPDDTLVQRYRFLDGNGYVNMAQTYGEYLRAKPEMRGECASEEMPVNVELVGAINKVEVKLGIPVEATVPTTTFEQADSIMNDLLEGGVKDLNLRMTGWCNGGAMQRVLTSIHVEGGLGGEKGMKKLIASAAEKGVDLYFDGISCFAYRSGILNGFNTLSDSARATTRDLIKLYPYYIVTYEMSTWMDKYPYYLVKPSYAQRCAANLINGLKERGAAGVAFRDIGNLLSADYQDNNTVTREQVKAQDTQTLEDAVATGMKVIIKEGNAYAIPYADLITDMNLSGNAYALLDYSVPFYQIAIHGLKDYTGEALNMAGDPQTLLLESAEYGAGLNFTFMEKDTRVLKDTLFSCYTSSHYEPWKEEVIAMITRYQKEMAGLNRQAITGHERLNEDVAVTTYADGTQVYVNYSTRDYKAGSVTVPGRDYLVKRGGGQ
ncbi:MAG: hypothetical protein IKZ98_12775 [Clostridia bacterium]|nr:hypothetical protein [Clostridia bacterium]